MRKKISYKNVSHFRIVDEDEDKWWDLSRIFSPELLDVPGIVLKDGQFVSLPACVNWQLRIDKKIRVINKVIAPTFASTGDVDDPTLSELGFIKAYLSGRKK